MFNPNKTVFILGAGASWHYGYPTGEELVRKVVAKAHVTKEHCKQVFFNNGEGLPFLPNFVKRHSPRPSSKGTKALTDQWEKTGIECADIIARLTTVDPIVIDYFLGQNPQLGEIGKFLIAWVLLECEAFFETVGLNINRREQLSRSHDPLEQMNASNLDYIRKMKINDNWYRFIIHKLVTGCRNAESLLENKVTFVTFNYDVSLERELFRGLRSLAQFDKNNTVRDFFKGRFIHIYGKIREDSLAAPPPFDLNILEGATYGPREEPRPPDLWHRANDLFDTIYEASKGLRTIAPHEKQLDLAVENARRAIDEAGCVYILGYGFDENNNKLLELRQRLSLNKTHKTVMLTNVGDYNVINKKASRVLFGSPDHLLSDKPALSGHETGEYLCEKSIRNVYDAFAFDFDSPEELLLSSTVI